MLFYFILYVICMYVFVHNILEKSVVKGINDAKTPLYKYQTSIN